MRVTGLFPYTGAYNDDLQPIVPETVPLTRGAPSTLASPSLSFGIDERVVRVTDPAGVTEPHTQPIAFRIGRIYMSTGTDELDFSVFGSLTPSFPGVYAPEYRQHDFAVWRRSLDGYILNSCRFTMQSDSDSRFVVSAYCPFADATLQFLGIAGSSEWVDAAQRCLDSLRID